MDRISKILQRTPLLKNLYNNYLINKEEFFKLNKNEVLLMYRKYLKIIPKLYSREI